MLNPLLYLPSPLSLPFIITAITVSAYYIGRHRGTHERAQTLQKNVINPSPANLVLAFDIHDVMFKSDPKQIFFLLINMNDKIKLVRQFMRPSVLIDLAKLIKKRAVAEEYILTLADKHPDLKPFVPMGIAIANAQKPMLPTLKIIKELYERGYELHILSNIGPTILQDLHKTFPDVFGQFTKARVASPHDYYLRKPYSGMYEDYLAQLDHGKKMVLFIDDKLENIEAALSLGIIGIPFKSAKQLSQTLHELNVLSPSSPSLK